MTADPGRGSRLPALGPRGEGWVAGQFLLIGLLIWLSLPGIGPLADPRECLPVRWLALLGLVALAIGAWLVWRALRELGRNLTPLPRPTPAARLVETGIYARIRHPIYAGVALLGIGWAIVTASLPSFAAALALTAWLDLKSRREEAWLLERYPAYAAYRARTRRFLPGIY